MCLPGLPSASVATNIAQDQQNTWKMLMDMQQQMISFQTGLMRALETATVAATAARGAADAAQGSGRPSRPPEPASVPNVRCGQSTTRIHPIKELHDEALKYFEKQAVLHERNAQKLVRTQKEIDRLTSVISAMEQSKYNELTFIYPPGTSPFKAPSDVAEMNEALQESLENDFVLSFTIPKGTSRRNAMNISHHASNTFVRKVTLQAQTDHLAFASMRHVKRAREIHERSTPVLVSTILIVCANAPTSEYDVNYHENVTGEMRSMMRVEKVMRPNRVFAGFPLGTGPGHWSFRNYLLAMTESRFRRFCFFLSQHLDASVAVRILMNEKGQHRRRRPICTSPR